VPVLKVSHETHLQSSPSEACLSQASVRGDSLAGSRAMGNHGGSTHDVDITICMLMYVLMCYLFIEFIVTVLIFVQCYHVRLLLHYWHLWLCCHYSIDVIDHCLYVCWTVCALSNVFDELHHEFFVAHEHIMLHTFHHYMYILILYKIYIYTYTYIYIYITKGLCDMYVKRNVWPATYLTIPDRSEPSLKSG